MAVSEDYLTISGVLQIFFFSLILRSFPFKFKTKAKELYLQIREMIVISVATGLGAGADLPIVPRAKNFCAGKLWTD